ncbi:MAG: chorismate synthase [Coriobacteriaceae bacterium]|nr:chorismate synthase [Coriobacteriaceae bacterium]
MSSIIGGALKLSLFGQSHSPAIGCVLDGLPAGIPVDEEALAAFMARRAPGQRDTSTPRAEADAVRIVGGVAEGRTCGAPFAAVIENTNTRSRDYTELRRRPRPGHADFTAHERYGNWHDVAGGGHFSGRLTAPLCAAGGVALQALAGQGVRIAARILRLGADGSKAVDDALSPAAPGPVPQQAPDGALEALAANEAELGMAMVSHTAAERARELILEAADELDSIGGVIECVAWGMPAGVGDPIFDGIENRIARMAFGVPAVKGVEFGAGFAAAAMRGSEHNDPFAAGGTGPVPHTNHAGGILGGITTGAPVVWRAAVKPTASIGLSQHTVDLATGAEAPLTVRGRHDPCIVPRAVPVMEAVCALALLDALIEDGRFERPAPRPDCALTGLEGA